MGEFAPYQAPMQQAFPDAPVAAPAGGGPGPGSAVMDAIEARRAEATEGGPETFGAEEGKPVEEGDVTGEEEIRMPEEGEAFSASDAMKQTPEAVDKAADLLEEQTGTTVDEHYEQLTGNPPPANQNRRRTAEFLFEFGLNLLAQPGGMSPAQEFGQAATQTMSARMGRRDAAAAAESTERQQRFENKMQAREVGIRERELARLENQGDYEYVAGNDGNVYVFDGRTGEFKEAPGNLSLPSGTRAGTTSAVVQEINQFMAMRRRVADINGIQFEGTQMEVIALEQAERRILEQRDRPYDERTARRSARDDALQYLTASDEFGFMQEDDPEGAMALVNSTTEQFYNLEKYGSYEGEVVADDDGPDVGMLTIGEATPVTNNETGVTEHWTLNPDGTKRRVDPSEMN